MQLMFCSLLLGELSQSSIYSNCFPFLSTFSLLNIGVDYSLLNLSQGALGKGIMERGTVCLRTQTYAVARQIQGSASHLMSSDGSKQREGT